MLTEFNIGTQNIDSRIWVVHYILCPDLGYWSHRKCLVWRKWDTKEWIIVRRRIPILILGLLLFSAAVVLATPGPPLVATDLGEGLAATEPEFDFKDPAMAGQQLLAVLDQSPDMAKHLRAIRAYQKRFDENGEAVPRLRDLVVSLRGSKRELAGVEAAFTIGLLIQDDAKETRAQYIKDLAPLVAGDPPEPAHRGLGPSGRGHALRFLSGATGELV